MYAKQLSSLFFSFDVNIQLNQSNINETKSKCYSLFDLNCYVVKNARNYRF